MSVSAFIPISNLKKCQSEPRNNVKENVETIIYYYKLYSKQIIPSTISDYMMHEKSPRLFFTSLYFRYGSKYDIDNVFRITEISLCFLSMRCIINYLLGAIPTHLFFLMCSFLCPNTYS